MKEARHKNHILYDYILGDSICTKCPEKATPRRQKVVSGCLGMEVRTGINCQWGDFPGGSVAETPCSQCRGPGFDPWSGNRSHMLLLIVCMPKLKVLHATTERSHTWQRSSKILSAATKTQCSQINE